MICFQKTPSLPLYLCLQSEDSAVEFGCPLVSGVFVDLQLLQLSLCQPQLLSHRLGVMRLLFQVLLNTTHTRTHTRTRSSKLCFLI